MAINDRTRASDADRDRTTAALQEHLVAGRLTKDEFDERLGQVYAAKTLGELDEVMADLPAADFGQLPGASLRPSADRLPPARSSPAWRAAWGSWLSISLFVFVIWLIGGASVSLWFVWAAAAAGALMLGRWSTDAPARSERRSARHGHDHR